MLEETKYKKRLLSRLEFVEQTEAIESILCYTTTHEIQKKGVAVNGNHNLKDKEISY